MKPKFGEKWRTKHIRPSQAIKIIDFCINEIKREGMIPARELAERVMKQFPGVIVTPHWLSKRVKIFNHAGIEKYPTTIKGKHMVVYSVKGKRKIKKCRYCGKEAPWKGKNFCSDECEREFEKIVNFYIPLPEGLKYSYNEIKSKMEGGS